MRSRFYACPLLTLEIVAAVAGMLEASDWPQWRGPDRTGIAAGEAIRSDWSKNPPRLLWMVTGVGSGYASVAVSDGKLYTTGNRREGQAVTCLDAASGREVWSSPISNVQPDHWYPGSRCTPSVDGGRVYAISSDGHIACLDTGTGSLVWSQKFEKFAGKMMSKWGYSESPLVDGDRVLCTPGGPKAMVVALDKETGRDLWRSSVPNLGPKGEDGAGYSSIVISNAAGVKQYVQLTGRGLIGIQADNGRFLWGYNKVANKTANIPTPIVSGDYVFTSTGYQTGAALVKIKQTGSRIHAEQQYFLDGKTFQNHHGGMVLVGDYIYAGHQHKAGFPTCVELKTGKIVWGGNQRGPGSGSAAVTGVGDKLLFRYEDGVVALIAADPAQYRLLGAFRPEYQEKESWSHPVVVDGRLYLREQDKVMCYDVK